MSERVSKKVLKKPSRVLILGGVRFHGKALALAFHKSGCEVTILSRGNWPIPYGLQHLSCDRTDLRSLRQVLSGKRFDLIIDNNAYHPKHVEDLFSSFSGLEEPPRAYFFTSTAAVYQKLASRQPVLEHEVSGSPIDEDFDQKIRPYALNKWATEETVRRLAKNLCYKIIRLPNVFGDQDFLGKLTYFYLRLQDGAPILLEKEVETFTLVVVDEVVQLYLRLADESASLTLNLGHPMEYAYESFFTEVFGPSFQASQAICRVPATTLWRENFHLPFAWGPTLDLGQQKERFADVPFSTPNWKRALEWEKENVLEKCEEEYRTNRPRELELIRRYG